MMSSVQVIGEYVEFIYCACNCGFTRSKYVIRDNGKFRKTRIAKFIQGHNTRGTKGTVRKCLYYECDKIETYNGKRWEERWQNYQDGYLCHNHYYKIVRYPNIPKSYWEKYKRTPEQNKIMNEKYNKIYHPRRLIFKTKSILLKENPRTGYCSLCPNNIHDGSCKVTNIHHIQYHDNDPLKDTIELCVRCHNEMHSK